MAIITFGEILIDFLQIRTDELLPSYKAQPGGAPANVACAITTYGGTAKMIGKVGEDSFGQLLLDTLTKYRVNTDSVIVGEKPTTLAFVHLDEQGERSFSFYRNETADISLTKEDISHVQADCSIFHFGSNSLVNEHAFDVTTHLVKRAKQNDAVISFDPNIRESLWTDKKLIVPTIERILPYVDYLKLSEEECQQLVDSHDVYEAIRQLQRMYELLLVVVTLGENGAIAYMDSTFIKIDGLCVETVDTTGAGDCFIGALLAQMDGQPFTVQTIEQALHFANRAAAISTTAFGAIPSYPSLKIVSEW